MDGVFMKKCIRRIGICFLLAALVWSGTVIADRQRLRQELVRLHVVANSDSEADQAVKLRVKDAVVESLKDSMTNMTDAEQAKAYLQENLPRIEALANRVLREAGCDGSAAVSLATEEFAARVYDTFSLPAGVYDALRITIGKGQGHNWWCVVFPELCAPATVAGFEETAQCADFSDTLTAALEGREGYSIRFFFLDLLGKAETFLRRS